MNTIQTLISTMLPLLAGACCFMGCKEKVNTMERPALPDAVEKDTTAQVLPVPERHRTTVRAEADFPIEILDIFVYTEGGALACHGRSRCDSVELELDADGPCKVFAIANAGGTFNDSALQHHDSLLGLEYSLTDDAPDFPLMSGSGTIDADIQLTPLMSKVSIASVTAYLEEDMLAENPRVRLENVNSRGKVFAESGFPVQSPSDGPVVRLPHDIGLYTVYPHISLYCYPNDLSESSESNPRTVLVMQCEVQGKTRTIRIPVHPIGRGEEILVDIEIR